MKYLVIDGVCIPYEERRSKRAVRITIRVHPDKVTVSVPSRLSSARVQELLKSKHSWILKNWLIEQEKMGEESLQDGSTVPFLGINHSLIVQTHSRKRIVVELKDKSIYVQLPEIVPEAERSEQVRMCLLKWYRAQAARVFQERLEFFSRRMGVKYKEFRIKELKSKWGSCSSKGNINLNWKLALAPLNVLDYVVVHELAHLVHLNHSKDFWQLVERYFPDFKACKKWLRDNGQKLQI